MSHRESDDLGSIPDVCWNALQRLRHVAWHWARQCTDKRAFYIAALSIIFFLDFVSGDLALTELQILKQPSDFHCFEELEVGPGPALAHMCRPGTSAEIIAIVEPQSWLTARSMALFIPDFSKIQKNESLLRDFSKAHAPGWSYTFPLASQPQTQSPSRNCESFFTAPSLTHIKPCASAFLHCQSSLIEVAPSGAAAALAATARCRCCYLGPAACGCSRLCHSHPAVAHSSSDVCDCCYANASPTQGCSQLRSRGRQRGKVSADGWNTLSVGPELSVDN